MTYLTLHYGICPLQLRRSLYAQNYVGRPGKTVQVNIKMCATSHAFSPVQHFDLVQKLRPIQRTPFLQHPFSALRRPEPHCTTYLDAHPVARAVGRRRRASVPLLPRLSLKNKPISHQFLCIENKQWIPRSGDDADAIFHRTDITKATAPFLCLYSNVQRPSLLHVMLRESEEEGAGRWVSLVIYCINMAGQFRRRETIWIPDGTQLELGGIFLLGRQFNFGRTSCTIGGMTLVLHCTARLYRYRLRIYVRLVDSVGRGVSFWMSNSTASILLVKGKYGTFGNIRYIDQ